MLASDCPGPGAELHKPFPIRNLKGGRRDHSSDYGQLRATLQSQRREEAGE